MRRAPPAAGRLDSSSASPLDLLRPLRSAVRARVELTFDALRLPDETFFIDIPEKAAAPLLVASAQIPAARPTSQVP